MNVSIEQVLQFLGEEVVKVRLLEMENAMLRRELERQQQEPEVSSAEAPGSDDRDHA